LFTYVDVETVPEKSVSFQAESRWLPRRTGRFSGALARVVGVSRQADNALFYKKNNKYKNDAAVFLIFRFSENWRQGHRGLVVTRFCVLLRRLCETVAVAN